MAERGEATLASRPLRREWSSFLKEVPPVKGFDPQKILDELREDYETFDDRLRAAL